jgi:hypothetical protein
VCKLRDCDAAVIAGVLGATSVLGAAVIAGVITSDIAGVLGATSVLGAAVLAATVITADTAAILAATVITGVIAVGVCVPTPARTHAFRWRRAPHAQVVARWWWRGACSLLASAAAVSSFLEHRSAAARARARVLQILRLYIKSDRMLQIPGPKKETGDCHKKLAAELT